MFPQHHPSLHVLRTQPAHKQHEWMDTSDGWRLKTTLSSKSQTTSALLFSEEATAEGDHAKQDLKHLLHHIDLPLQLILSLVTISIHSDVETFIKLRRADNGWVSFYCYKHDEIVKCLTYKFLVQSPVRGIISATLSRLSREFQTSLFPAKLSSYSWEILWWPVGPNGVSIAFQVISAENLKAVL